MTKFFRVIAAAVTLSIIGPTAVSALPVEKPTVEATVQSVEIIDIDIIFTNPEGHGTCYKSVSGGYFRVSCVAGFGSYYARAYYKYQVNGVWRYGYAYGYVAYVGAGYPYNYSRGAVTFTRPADVNYKWTRCLVRTCYIVSTAAVH